MPLLTSPFWQAHNNYVPRMAEEAGLDVLRTVNADNDTQKQITDINNLLNQGVKGLVVTPLDSAAIVAGLNQAERRGVPVADRGARRRQPDRGGGQVDARVPPHRTVQTGYRDGHLRRGTGAAAR